MLSITDVAIDPELESFLPPLSAEERNELKAQIERDGFTDPIIVWQHHGYVIDGHNRYRIWQELGSDPDHAPDIMEKKFSDKAAVMEWMFKRQSGRRNWTAAQKAIVALKMKPAIEEKAAQNREERGGRPPKENTPKTKGKKLPQNSAAVSEKIETRKELAKIAGVSHDTISKVERVLEEAPPEIKQAMAAGEMSANAAYKAVKNRPSAGASFKPEEFDEAVAPDAEQSQAKPIPEHLTKVLEGVRAYKSLQHEVSRLYGKVEALAKEPIGSYIQLQEIQRHINQVKADLKAYSYGDNCPTCKNKPSKTCERCKGRGWLAHSQMGRLSDFDKQWLESNSVKP